MKRISIFTILLSLLIFSCSKDDDNDIKQADIDIKFTLTITGESPNAFLTIKNNSSEGEKYLWSFSEGGSISQYNLMQPPKITIDKPGRFEVKLTMEKDGLRSSFTKSVLVGGEMAISEFTDIEFALEKDHSLYGRLFSLTDGECHKESDIGHFMEESIHLALFSSSSDKLYFTSPTEKDFGLTKATYTKICNNHMNHRLKMEDYANISDDRSLSTLKVVNDKMSFGQNRVPRICTFETFKGRKGMIYIKEINESRLLADIKVQKY